MELSKHPNHRNNKYLDWLRSRPCAVSGSKAECAHHIRLGTNGGTGLKPSDYFCIPLLNEYHVSGPMALHVIGEETFLKHFGLDAKELFISYLKDFLAEAFDILYMLEGRTQEQAIAELISLIENKLPKLDKVGRKPKKTKKKKDPELRAPSPSDSEFYQKAKELKREKDKELRRKLKSERTKSASAKQSLKGTPAYERAKELKRERDKELRKMLKSKPSASKSAKPSAKGNEYYERAKELQKLRAKQYRKKMKERMKENQNSL